MPVGAIPTTPVPIRVTWTMPANGILIAFVEDDVLARGSAGDAGSRACFSVPGALFVFPERGMGADSERPTGVGEVRFVAFFCLRES